MTHEPKKSDLAKVAMKPTKKIRTADGGGVSGAKGGDQGERGPAKHPPDADSGLYAQGSRVTDAGTRTSSSKGEKEGTVRRAAPPC